MVEAITCEEMHRQEQRSQLDKQIHEAKGCEKKYLSIDAKTCKSRQASGLIVTILAKRAAKYSDEAVYCTGIK